MTKIELIRTEQNLTRTDLANLAGLKPKDIKDAEELTEMYISESVSIARALGVRPSTIRVISADGCFAREKKR